MRTAANFLVMALAIAPQMALAAGESTASTGNAGATSSFSQSRYDLASASDPVEKVTKQIGQRKFAPELRGLRHAEGARFGDGGVQYIEGPSWDYRMSRRGPMFEVAALGGGTVDTPYLAHVAMNWRF